MASADSNTVVTSFAGLRGDPETGYSEREMQRLA
jgi:hypothetical protein